MLPMVEKYVLLTTMSLEDAKLTSSMLFMLVFASPFNPYREQKSSIRCVKIFIENVLVFISDLFGMGMSGDKTNVYALVDRRPRSDAKFCLASKGKKLTENIYRTWFSYPSVSLFFVI